MKKAIDLTTRTGSALHLTVEGFNGMILITAHIGGSEYTRVRLPQELKQWPINGILRMNANAGSDFGGQLIAELDDDSARRLSELVAEAAERCEEPREIDAPETSAEIESAQEEWEPENGPDDEFWDNIWDD